MLMMKFGEICHTAVIYIWKELCSSIGATITFINTFTHTILNINIQNKWASSQIKMFTDVELSLLSLSGISTRFCSNHYGSAAEEKQLVKRYKFPCGPKASGERQAL